MSVAKNGEKIFCNECGWHGTFGKALRAKNPFDKTMVVFGCPSCHEIGDFGSACDVKNCWEYVSAGTPTSQGYKNFCSKHYREFLKTDKVIKETLK